MVGGKKFGPGLPPGAEEAGGELKKAGGDKTLGAQLPEELFEIGKLPQLSGCPSSLCIDVI